MDHHNQALKFGSGFSEKELKERSKAWDALTWEEFLSKTVDYPLKEHITEKSSSIEHLDSSLREMYQQMLERNTFPKLEQIIGLLINELSKREYTVIFEIYWQGESLRKVAKNLDISKSSVAIHRDRALKKLGKLFFENIANKS